MGLLHRKAFVQWQKHPLKYPFYPPKKEPNLKWIRVNYLLQSAACIAHLRLELRPYLHHHEAHNNIPSNPVIQETHPPFQSASHIYLIMLPSLLVVAGSLGHDLNASLNLLCASIYPASYQGELERLPALLQVYSDLKVVFCLV